jgi:hypothetical protein
MAIAIVIIGVPLIIFIGFVLGTRKLGNAGVREYQFGIDDAPDGPDRHPRCACYYSTEGGPWAGGGPRWVNGRLCEEYFLSYGQWPPWCHGPEE